MNVRVKSFPVSRFTFSRRTRHSSGSAEEIPGRGLIVHNGNHVIFAGNRKLLAENGVECEDGSSEGTWVYVAKDGVYEGRIRMRDEIRRDAVEGIGTLKEKGISCLITWFSAYY